SAVRRGTLSVDVAERQVDIPEWQTCDVLGTEVEFFVRGSGRPLVFLDGSFGFRPDGPFIGDLAAGFSVVAIRLPGFGDKSLPGWITSTDDYAYLGLAVIRRLGLDGTVLVVSSV